MTQTFVAMKKFVYLCTMLLFSLNMMAQIVNDRQLPDSLYCPWGYKDLNVRYQSIHYPITPGWRCDSIHSDEFNGAIIDTTKWVVKDRSWHKQNGHVGFLDSYDNVSVKDGKLFLSVTENTDSLDFFCSWCSESNSDSTIIPELISGWITFCSSIRYGYIETECYLPKNHNYWPCFWTTGRDYISNDDYDEVDVFERTSSNQTDYPNKIRQNCYNGAGCTYPSYLTQILTFPDSITGKTIVFGAEILPEEVVFYINGQVSSHLRYDENHDHYNHWNTFTCTDIEEMIPMHMILSLICDSDQTTIPIPQESSWFEYVRCYKLERGSGSTFHPTVFSPSNESTKVYPHVVLGGVGYTSNVNTPTAIWAEQDIILDKGFELASNTAFSARVINVPDPEHSKLYIQNLLSQIKTNQP